MDWELYFIPTLFCNFVPSFGVHLLKLECIMGWKVPKEAVAASQGLCDSTASSG